MKHILTVLSVLISAHVWAQDGGGDENTRNQKIYDALNVPKIQYALNDNDPNSKNPDNIAFAKAAGPLACSSTIEAGAEKYDCTFELSQSRGVLEQFKELYNALDDGIVRTVTTYKTPPTSTSGLWETDEWKIVENVVCVKSTPIKLREDKKYSEGTPAYIDPVVAGETKYNCYVEL